MNATPIPLWRQLQSAASVLAALADGRSLASTLPAVPPDLRPGVQALVHEALRHWGLARALRAQLARRAPPPQADALLTLALALAASAQPVHDAHTLVDQTVEAAKRQRATHPQAAFLNACLRRFLREQSLLVERALRHDEARWNAPVWWIERLRRDWPAQWKDIATQSARRAAMTLRVNTRKTTVAQYLEALREAGLEGRAHGGQGIVLASPCPVERLPGFAQGLASVQDAAAQLAAPLLLDALGPSAPGRPWRILDACAAPGGKTAQLLELADARVTALEIDPKRALRISETLARLGLSAQVLTADAAEPRQWWDGEPFDAILLDAPCTASGIVRRHPDIPWLRRPDDVAQLAATQARLLRSLWPLLKPGGVLHYCTCSVFRDEGERQIEAFVAHNTGARTRPAPGHLHPVGGGGTEGFPDNPQGEHDGFFHALLQKGA